MEVSDRNSATIRKRNQHSSPATGQRFVEFIVMDSDELRRCDQGERGILEARLDPFRGIWFPGNVDDNQPQDEIQAQTSKSQRHGCWASTDMENNGNQCLTEYQQPIGLEREHEGCQFR